MNTFTAAFEKLSINNTNSFWQACAKLIDDKVMTIDELEGQLLLLAIPCAGLHSNGPVEVSCSHVGNVPTFSNGRTYQIPFKECASDLHPAIEPLANLLFSELSARQKDCALLQQVIKPWLATAQPTPKVAFLISSIVPELFSKVQRQTHIPEKLAWIPKAAPDLAVRLALEVENDICCTEDDVKR